jgi:hypothetical protein
MFVSMHSSIRQRVGMTGQLHGGGRCIFEEISPGINFKGTGPQDLYLINI